MQTTVSEISQRLSEQVETICGILLPGGRRNGSRWEAGDVSGASGKSLKVNLDGQHVGRWHDFAAGEEAKGDLLDLYRSVRGCTLPEAVKWAKDFLGIKDPAISSPMRSYAPAPTNGVHPIGSRKDPVAVFLCDTRGILPAIVKRFKIVIDEKGNVVFPRYDLAGKVVNRSYRTLPKEGAKKEVWQDKGCAPALFGWQALDPKAFTERRILICEGDIDAMTWTQWGIPALSVPNGSGMTWIDYEWENLAVFDHIYLSYDMEDKTKNLVQKAIARLGPHRCLIVRLPHKDANDCLLQGCTGEDAAGWIANAEFPKIRGLVAAEDLKERFEEEMREKPEAFHLPFLAYKWPDNGIFFRPGEVTVWVGPPFSGKSSLLNFTAMSLVSNNTPVFIASMEVKPERTLRKTFAAVLGKLKGQTDDFFKWAGRLVIFADVVGYLGEPELLEMMRFAWQRYGVQHFIIDSLMRIKGLEEEYAKQGDFVNALSSFAQETDTHIHLVAHSRKLQEGERPSGHTIKGSSLIHNNADNVISVMRNTKKDKLRYSQEHLTPEQENTMHDTEVFCEKQRESGWIGSFKLRFNPQTYCFSTFKVRQ